MMARGIREKGWIEAIKAFKLLQMVREDSYLILISTESEHIKTLKIQNQANKNIIFIGYQADPSAILYSSNCMVLPSYFPESLPYTITESLACSKPVLACPIAEIPAMLNVNDQIAGYLIPLDNEGVANVDILAEKLIELATNSIVLQEKEMLSNQAFQKFSMEICGSYYKSKLLDIMQ